MGRAGEILNGHVTYPGPVQVLVHMPGPGSAERHDPGLACHSRGEGATAYNNVGLANLARCRCWMIARDLGNKRCFFKVSIYYFIVRLPPTSSTG